MSDERAQRLFALQRAAGRIAAPETGEGRQARALLRETTGLSPAGVEYALSECLEHGTSRSTLSQLVRVAPPSPRAHVLLSANVFVAAYRAIALALAQSSQVFVRASRRDPTMAALLHEGSGGAFELVDELSPAPGEHFWGYGSDGTLEMIREQLPPGVHFHAHGSGMGAAVVQSGPSLTEADLFRAADALARDTIAFDQRGCASPRVVFVEGGRTFAETFAGQLLRALREWEHAVPRGELSEEERADAIKYETTMTYVGSCASTGAGLLFLDPVSERVVVPPVGRYLHLCVTEDAVRALSDLAPRLTTIGFFNAERLPGRCRDLFGERRYVEVGHMQRPPLDGPLDQRRGWGSETI